VNWGGSEALVFLNLVLDDVPVFACSLGWVIFAALFWGIGVRRELVVGRIKTFFTNAKQVIMALTIRRFAGTVAGRPHRRSPSMRVLEGRYYHAGNGSAGPWYGADDFVSLAVKTDSATGEVES